MKRVAFQGELGAFSQVAAAQLAGARFTPVPLPAFDAVFAAVANGKCERAVIPIENTLHGSVHENYDLLLKFPLTIEAETSVRIVHNVIAPPGVHFRDIRLIYSHPVALNQCRRFFEKNPAIERVPFYDTAGSVKMIMRDLPPGAAAIASAAAAAQYGASILRKSIEDDPENFTRFFYLAVKHTDGRNTPRRSKNKQPQAKYKTSIVFGLRNVPGGLFRALAAFALRDLNLTKIESRPLRGKPWEYLFYLDFIGHADAPAARNALNQLGEITDSLTILGCYPAAA